MRKKQAQFEELIKKNEELELLNSNLSEELLEIRDA
jgi:hypothetical protein